MQDRDNTLLESATKVQLSTLQLYFRARGYNCAILPLREYLKHFRSKESSWVGSRDLSKNPGLDQPLDVELCAAVRDTKHLLGLRNGHNGHRDKTVSQAQE